MERINLTVEDKFTVIQKALLGDYDRKILARLYQPLCSANAINLFLTLWSELECDKTISSLDKNHGSLLNQLNIDLNTFINSRKQLEALGLIRTLYNKESGYYYLLYAPKNPAEFFTYPLFATRLFNRVGEVEYERTKTYFALPHFDESDYLDISQDYTDVFDNAHSVVERNGGLIGKETITPSFDFDFNTLYTRLKENHVSKNSMNEEVKQEVAVLAIANGIPAYDMADILFRCLDDKGKVDVERLHTAVAKSKGFVECTETKRSAPIKTGNLSLDEKIETYNTNSLSEFLRIKNGGIDPVERDLRLVIDLKNTTGLPDSVINAIVDFALERNSNRLNKAYLQTIAGSVIRSKIIDAYDAYIYLNESKKKVTNVVKTRVAKVAQEMRQGEDKVDDISDEELMASLNALKALKERGK